MRDGKNAERLLQLMERPAFTVKKGKVAQVSQGAMAKLIQPGQKVEPMIRSGAEEYRALVEGSLCLTLQIAESLQGAAVCRLDGDTLLFLLDEEADLAGLRLLAQAAKQLRDPLSNVMDAADQLFPQLDDGGNLALQKQMAWINQGLFQILRIVGNMADAGSYLGGVHPFLESTELDGFFGEIFEKAVSLTQSTGVQITYTPLGEEMEALVDRQRMERAVLNLLSNALRYTPKDGHIHARLLHRGLHAVLQIQDDGEGLHQQVMQDLFNRYRREPAVEDGRYGLGLGLLLVRQVARLHGGTVFVGPAPGNEPGTLAALSIRIGLDRNEKLRAPLLQVDYTGARDIASIELSRELPTECFYPQWIN